MRDLAEEQGTIPTCADLRPNRNRDLHEEDLSFVQSGCTNRGSLKLSCSLGDRYRETVEEACAHACPLYARRSALCTQGAQSLARHAVFRFFFAIVASATTSVKAWSQLVSGTTIKASAWLSRPPQFGPFSGKAV